MVEQTISIELTETEYKHIKEVLAMDKPSRTRLTQYEKDYLLRLVYLDMEAIPSKDWVI
jgi:hypothetical protein